MDRVLRSSSGLTVNGVAVSVVADRIEDLVRSGDYDALVSSDDTRLSMSGGVSAAILSAAGSAIRDEVSKLVPVRLGEVALTSAGKLPARYILHVAILDAELAVRPSEQTIRIAAQSVFRRCEFVGIKRLAMPALGTGAAQFSVDDSARLIVGALAEHAVNATVLEQVAFCLPDLHARQLFLDYVGKAIHQSINNELDTAIRADRLGGGGRDQHGAEFGAMWPTASRSRNRDVASGKTLGPPAPSAPKAGRIHGLRRLRDWLAGDRPIPPDTTFTDDEAPHVPLGGVKARPRAQANRPLLCNRYVLLEELGRGGMGIVYLAWDIVLRQVVAIKTLRSAGNVSPEQAEALRREASLQIRLAHEGIVRLLNFEPWDDAFGPFIIMEYLSWTSGDRWIAEAGMSGLPPRAVLSVGERLCGALAYAHDSSVLHGDIKPSNVFVDPAGENVKLADFGIAKVMGTTRRNALVTSLVGTPAYMAPEQKTLGAQLGPWTDIYLLARTLAEFIGAKTNRQGEVQFPDVGSMAPAVAALQKGLAPRPDQRPADARLFGKLLNEAERMLPSSAAFQ